MNAAFLESEDGRRMIEGFPNRRIGHPADIEGPLMLLASDAGAFITGSVIAVDDGQGL